MVRRGQVINIIINEYEYFKIHRWIENLYVIDHPQKKLYKLKII
jgi:hypothetical protein